MNDSQLDELLNAPLAGTPDNGFSTHVMVRVRKEQLKEQILFYATAAACAAAVLLFVPLPQITTAMAHILTEPAVSLAIAVLVLTFTAERALAQR